jgi:hypothetical protein
MACGFSAPSPPPATAAALARNVAQQDKAFAVDQAAWTSPRFWADFEKELKAAGIVGDRASLARFDAFANNLRTEKPGDIVTMPNGQEIFKQYVYPGLDSEWRRTPFPPVNDVPGAQTLASCAAVARTELLASLAYAPLRNDDGQDAILSCSSGSAEGQQDTPWHRAAWYGWQFLPLRAQRQAFKGTIAHLKAGAVPLGHRFVGVARQRANCHGTVHSDHRNYMLSTLTPLVVPGPNTCGVVGYSRTTGSGTDIQTETKVLTEGELVVLDNSFPHEVYNNGDEDRFVLMAEVWHPALSTVEQRALQTLFACRDRFALLEFAERPWGVGQAELLAAIENGDLEDITFWKDCCEAGERSAEVPEGLVGMSAAGPADGSTSRTASAYKHKKPKQGKSGSGIAKAKAGGGFGFGSK